MPRFSWPLSPKAITIVVLLNLIIGLSSLTLSLTRPSEAYPRFAILNTQAVIESQKVLWLRDLNEAGQSQEAYSAFLKSSERFPHELQKALHELQKKHNVILVNHGVFATSDMPDLTQQLFEALQIEPQAVSTARTLLQRQTFGLSR